MDEYKKGDKFVIEIEAHIGVNKNGGLYRIKGFNALVFDNYGLSKLERLPDTQKDGMTAEEAWEIAKTITGEKEYGGPTYRELCEIFGDGLHKNVFRDHTPQEAKAKIDAWRGEKEKIQVGDVVTWDEYPEMMTGAVISVCEGRIGILCNDAKGYNLSCDHVTKTGRHIDIQSVLDQIGGDGDG